DAHALGAAPRSAKPIPSPIFLVMFRENGTTLITLLALFLHPGPSHGCVSLHGGRFECSFALFHVNGEFDARTAVARDEGILVSLERSFEFLERQRLGRVPPLLLQ